LYEVGRIYLHRRSGKLPEEKNIIGCLLTGARYEDLWHFKDLQGDFYDLKGVVENLFDDLRISGVKFAPDAKEPFLHPGRSCSLFIADERIGFLGEIHPNFLGNLSLKNPATVCEIDLDMLIAFYKSVVAYKDLSRFPSSARDVAFLIGAETKSDAILSSAMQANEELLEKVSIFDVYDGKGIPEGMKSFGLRFCYRSSDRTLTDEEVNQVHSRIVKSIIVLTGATIRGDYS